MRRRITDRDTKARIPIATLVTTHHRYGKDIDACGNVSDSSTVYFKRLVGVKAITKEANRLGIEVPEWIKRKGNDQDHV